MCYPSLVAQKGAAANAHVQGHKKSNMLFLAENPASARLLGAAGLLVAGEAAGFALARLGLSVIWPGLALAGLVGALAAYGLWGARRLAFPLVFALGLVLALRTDATLRAVLDENAGLHGPRSALRLPVEGDVRSLPSKKKKSPGHPVRHDFLSHIGPIPLKVVVSVPPGGAVPQPGETWLMNGWISQKDDPARRYGRRTFWVPETAAVRCPETNLLDVARANWSALGEALARRVELGLDWNAELVGLNRAILLGRRSDLSPERKQTFADAGTIHVFAISGLHVMVIAWLLKESLTRLGAPPRLRGLVCIPLMWAYVILTGARPSAIRAATMATFLLAAPTFNRRPDMLASWSVTAFAVYGLSPENLFDLGCALSFAVMFGIVFWLQWVQHFEPWFEEKSRARRYAAELGVSFAAWLAGVPLTAYAFGRFTPGGLLANFAVLRCAKWTVRFGAGGLAASFVCLPLAALLNIVSATCTWSMTWVSETVAHLPFSNFIVTPWSGFTCLLWYVACFLVLDILGHVLPRRGLAPRRWWKAPRRAPPRVPLDAEDAYVLALEEMIRVKRRAQEKRLARLRRRGVGSNRTLTESA